MEPSSKTLVFSGRKQCRISSTTKTTPVYSGCFPLGHVLVTLLLCAGGLAEQGGSWVGGVEALLTQGAHGHLAVVASQPHRYVGKTE